MAERHRSADCRVSRSTSNGPPVCFRAAARNAVRYPRPSPPAGVSAASLIGFLAQHGTPLDAPPERHTTRCVAMTLRRRRQAVGVAGPYAESLAGGVHFMTGGALAGNAAVYVAHAWDANFAQLVACLAADAAGDLDRMFAVDVFTVDLQQVSEDPVAEVQRSVAGANEVLLVLDAEAHALRRTWVLFEALLAVAAGKLRVRCSAPGGFGSSEEALDFWEARIDCADWEPAQATRRADERRLRAFVEKTWEAGAKGIEQRLAQFKRLLRREVYGQLLLGAVERGDQRAVQAALDRGANPEQQDLLGNTAEELAAFHGHTGIEELLFMRRMKRLPHRRLSAFFRPQELLAAAKVADPDVLAPFLTESGAEETTCANEEVEEAPSEASLSPERDSFAFQRVMRSGHAYSWVSS